MDDEMKEKLKEMSKIAGKRRVDWKSDVDKMSKALENERISARRSWRFIHRVGWIQLHDYGD